MAEQKSGSGFWVWILVIILLVGGIRSCSGCGSDSGSGSPTRHTCMKCNGTGKYRGKDTMWLYVTCPRCDGFGYLLYD